MDKDISKKDNSYSLTEIFSLSPVSNKNIVFRKFAGKTFISAHLLLCFFFS